MFVYVNSAVVALVVPLATFQLPQRVEVVLLVVTLEKVHTNFQPNPLAHSIAAVRQVRRRDVVK